MTLILNFKNVWKSCEIDSGPIGGTSAKISSWPQLFGFEYKVEFF